MKRAANLSIDAEVLTEAKQLGINLSQTLETALIAKIKEAKSKNWLEENKEAIDSYNEYIRKHGTFGQRYLSSRK